MKTSLFIPTLAASLFLSPALVAAQPQDAPPNRPNQGQGDVQMRRGPGLGAPMQQRRMAMHADLGLTDVQKADLQKLRETSRKDRLRKSTDLKIARLDLHSLLRAEKVDEKAVAAKLAEVSAAQAAMLKLRVDSALAMKRILTPEQQKKMQSMRANRGHQRMNRSLRMKGQGRGNRQDRGRGRMNHPMGAGPGGDETDLDLDLDLDEDIR